MPLARHIVAAMHARLPKSVHRDDLMSAAAAGLAEAAASFDPEKGASFSHFATLRIRGAVLDELRSLDWAPRSLRREGRRLEEATAALAGDLGRQPTSSELADRLKVAAGAVEKARADLERSVVVNYESLVPTGDAERVLPQGGTSPEDALMDRELRSYLTDAVRNLPERLRTVVVEYFFEERPMQDIADDLGVTESRVSQMRAEALALMRDGINTQLDPGRVAPEPLPNGRLSRRKAGYYASLAEASTFRQRVSAQPVYVPSVTACYA